MINTLERSILVHKVLEMATVVLYLMLYWKPTSTRTASGVQYADLSSLILHVVHSELRRSSNVVLSPMASMQDQINICHSSDQMRTVRTHDGVTMFARLAGSNDWVSASIEDRLGAC